MPKKWVASHRASFQSRQSSRVHRYQTAREIIGQIPGGCVDAVVSGVGTGGTLVGLWEGFTDHGCEVKAYAARPTTGLALDGAECCSFSGRIPGVADGLSTIYAAFQCRSPIELDIRDDEALETARRLIRQGFPVGPSSGLNFEPQCSYPNASARKPTSSPSFLTAWNAISRPSCFRPRADYSWNLVKKQRRLLAASWAWLSAPRVQYVDPVASRKPRICQLGDRGSNPAISQVVTRVVVEPDNQNPGMMAGGCHYHVMEVFEIFGILGQNRDTLGDRINQHPRIRDRQQSDITGKDWIVPLSPESQASAGYSGLRRSGISFWRRAE